MSEPILNLDPIRARLEAGGPRERFIHIDERDPIGRWGHCYDECGCVPCAEDRSAQ